MIETMPHSLQRAPRCARAGPGRVFATIEYAREFLAQEPTGGEAMTRDEVLMIVERQGRH